MQLDSYMDLYAEAHAHSPECWWDHLKPGWVCAPVQSTVTGLVPEQAAPAAEPASMPVA
jgi:hypothetical protein